MLSLLLLVTRNLVRSSGLAHYVPLRDRHEHQGLNSPVTSKNVLASHMRSSSSSPMTSAHPVTCACWGHGLDVSTAAYAKRCRLARHVPGTIVHGRAVTGSHHPRSTHLWLSLLTQSTAFCPSFTCTYAPPGHSMVQTKSEQRHIFTTYCDMLA